MNLAENFKNKFTPGKLVVITNGLNTSLYSIDVVKRNADDWIENYVSNNKSFYSPTNGEIYVIIAHDYNRRGHSVYVLRHPITRSIVVMYDNTFRLL